MCLLLVCLTALQMLYLPARAAEAEQLPEEILEEPLEIVEEIAEEIWEEPEELPQEEIFGEEIPEESIEEDVVEEILEEVISEETSEEASEDQEVLQEKPVQTVYEQVPLYFQTDYPDVYYGEGTVATSGCSMTSLAMVATYLTGYEYLPDTLARYFAFCGDSNMARLEYGSEMLQLPFEKNWDWHVTLQALREGKIAIVLLDSGSQFTHSQHFVVLTGLTEEGRILVKDPYAPNYSHWALQQGFEHGFTEDQIVCGFQGAWVYDKNLMPEEPFFYIEEDQQENPEESSREQLETETVPLYFQEDYPNTRYAGGTVATSGCSITSLAMVATYMTGHEYLPDELARYFGGRAENHMERLEIGSDTLQLPYEKNTNWHTTLEALWDGKIAIVLVNEKTHFTQSQHFLVLTGVTSAGKVLVNDSAFSNYSHWALTDGFVNGFDPDDIMIGFEGAWVYDKSAMPEDPVLYYEPKPIHDETRYPDVHLTLEEEDLLAKLIWAEARGECADGQQAVAEVVLNRMVSEDFADSLEAVICGDGQFRGASFMKDALPAQAQYDAIENALYGPNILPMDVFYFATWKTNDNVWGQIEDHIFCYAEKAGS